MKNRLLTLAGLLALLAVLGKFYAEPLFAQVRAALVQNVDEAGRNPFALRSNNVNEVFHVPADKRYVIQTFSAECDVDNTGYLSQIRLTVIKGGTIQFAAIPAIYQDQNFSAAGHPVSLWYGTGSTHLYADPATTISLEASSNFNQTGAVVRDCEFSVSGYAINNP
jgi:hypothetical protein